MAATADKTTYSGAFGKRDSASGVDVNADSLFVIASMTKPVTSVAAMQLVEQGKLKLDEPASAYIKELGSLQVLHGFDETGKPVLKLATKPVTLRTLLTHTSGFVYDVWFADMARYEKASGTSAQGVAPLTPLMFEPGSRWQYGTSADWSGRLVETVSGLSLEQYFQKNIFEPLGMHDTSFLVPAAKFDRLVSEYHRGADGTGPLQEDPRALPKPPKAFNGGGGLYSTAPDYVRFMQIILRRGRGPKGEQILQPKTVDTMATIQTGDLSCGKLKSARPAISSDVDFHPGFKDGFGFGFLINSKAYEGGRSAGSLAWAGIANTYFWIDPKKQVAGVIMMQFLPFADKEAIAVLGDFERAVYAS